MNVLEVVRWGIGTKVLGVAHTHSSTSVAPADSDCTDDEFGSGGQKVALCDHEHGLNSFAMSVVGTDLPPYRDLFLCESSFLDIVSGLVVPLSGEWGDFSSEWGRFSELDGRFVRISSCAGCEGGALEHQHELSGMTETPTQTTEILSSGARATFDHRHYITTVTTSSGSNLPSYIRVVFAQSLSNSSFIPSSVVWYLLGPSLPPKGFEPFSAFDGTYFIGHPTNSTSVYLPVDAHHNATVETTGYWTADIEYGKNAGPPLISRTTHNHGSVLWKTSSVPSQDVLLDRFEIQMVTYNSSAVLYQSGRVVFVDEIEFGCRVGSVVCSGLGNCSDDSGICDVCVPGAIGDLCEDFNCSGLHKNDDDVCWGYDNLTCVGPNQCECAEGFSGSECEIIDCYGKNTTDPGSQGTCSHPNGTCVGHDQCSCPVDEYAGGECQYTVCFGGNTSDVTTVCSYPNGSCVAPDTCLCLDGYTGPECEFIVCYSKTTEDPLTSGTCSFPNGTCVAPGACLCSTGYSGDQCEFFVCHSKTTEDPGLSLTCSHPNGTCVAPEACLCYDGYTGDECEFLVCHTRSTEDPALSRTCSSPNGTCVAPDQCVCHDGYSGTECEFIICHDKTTENPSVEGTCSFPNGTCVAPSTCLCVTGYTGPECEFIDCYGNSTENPLLENTCSYPNGSCVAPDTCLCLDGYTGDQCEYLVCHTKTTEDPGTEVTCSYPNGTCVAPDSCLCSEGGYRGPECEFIVCHNKSTENPVAENTCSSPNGTCVAPDACLCRDGYTGDECEFLVCHSKTTENPGASGTCSSPNGTCVAPDDCLCQSGYTGDECEFLVCHTRSTEDPALSRTCSSPNGTCVAPDQCVCHDGYSGTECEFIICHDKTTEDPSVSITCSFPNGTCVAPNTCMCSDGYTGDECEFLVCSSKSTEEPALSQTCSHPNGTCVAPDTCLCYEGYAGDECEFLVCHLKTTEDPVGFGTCSSPNGTCVAPDQCICHDGYTGNECEETVCHDLSTADSRVCSSPNGSCVAPDACLCRDGYTGDECEFIICFTGSTQDPGNVCSSPNGLCVGPDDCLCLNGYHGESCTDFDCDIYRTTNGQCSGRGMCLGPNRCLCLVENSWSGPGCNVPVCYNILATDNRTCSAHGTCAAPDLCDCLITHEGDQCEGALVTGLSAEQIKQALEYVGMSVGVIVVLIGLVLVSILVFCICYRRCLRQKYRTFVEQSASEAIPDDPMSSEPVTQVSIHKEIHDLGIAVEMDEFEKIPVLCRELEKTILGNPRGLLRPGTIARNFTDILLKPDAMSRLGVDCQVAILRVFERLLSVILLFHSDEKFNYRFVHELPDVMKEILEKAKKEQPNPFGRGRLVPLFGELELEIQSIIEAVKHLNVADEGFADIVKQVFNIRETGALLGRVKAEWEKLPARWYPRLQVFRKVGYAGSDQKIDRLRVLLEMVKKELDGAVRKRKTRKKTFGHLLNGIVNLLGDIAARAEDEQLIHAVFLGLSNAEEEEEEEGENSFTLGGIDDDFPSLYYFCGYDNALRKSTNRRIRCEALRAVEDLMKRHFDSERLMDAVQSCLVQRSILESHEKLREHVLDLQQQVGGYADAIREENQRIVRKLDDRWSRLRGDIMLHQQRVTENEARKAMLPGLKEDLDLREGRLEMKHQELSPMISAKEDKQAELKKLKKELSHLRDFVDDVDESRTRERERTLRGKILDVEVEIGDMDALLHGLESLENVVEKKRKEILFLEEDIASEDEVLHDLMEFLREEQTDYDQCSENYDQVRKDYELALQLQQEIIREKNEILERRAEADVDEKEILQARQELMELSASIAAGGTEEEYDEQPPEELCCPISMELLEDPVIAASGQTYSRVNIEKWLASSNKDPSSGQELIHTTLLPNIGLKKAVESWKEAHCLK